MRSESPPQPLHSLAAVPAFKELEPDVMQAIAQVAVRRSFASGEVVFLEGEPCAGLCVVQTGWLKAIRTSFAGREQIIFFLGPGELFNDAGVIVSARNTATVRALEPASLWVLPRDALLRLTDRHPSLLRAITQNLAERVLHLMALVEDLALQTVEGRLARIFLEHGSGDVLSRRRWSTQAEMAARLGTVPDVLNRALRSLAEEGLIHIERHQVRILDRPGLARKAMLGE